MNLLIDIGNTRLKWCLFEANELSNSSALVCANQLHERLIAAWNNLSIPRQIIISSVAAPAITNVVISVIAILWNNTPIIAQVQQNTCGLTTCYSNPAQLGIDRWLVLLAAIKRGTEAAVVVDCGTAVTIDVLNSYGQHTGGLIIPGLKLLWKTIFNGTGISPMEFPVSFNTLGKNTGECIAAGAVQAIVGAIETTYRQLANQESSPRLLVTGGDAIIISKHLTTSHLIIPNLVFEGLLSLLINCKSHLQNS